MKRNFKTALASVAMVSVSLSGISAPVIAQGVVAPQGEMTLSIGRGQLVEVDGRMADVFIANDEIADVQVKSERQLYIFGKAGGETTIYASDASGRVIYSANVRVGSNIDSIDQMMTLAMPDAKVSVATINPTTILLTGTVGQPDDAAEAARLVQAFVGEDTQVISRLRMATPLQVNLQVKIAEVSRSFVRAIGVNLSSYDPTSGFKFGITQGNSATQYQPGAPVVGGAYEGEPATIVPGVEGGTSLIANGAFLGLDLLGALDLAETQGLVTTLSNPNLTALSGETATFLAGGEFPIPLSQGLGTTTIEYKNYGVSLAYTPTVLSNGRISLRVRPEVSELSAQGAITLDGFQVPALTTRRTETSVELGSGQSMMIAGLLSNNSQNSIDKAPGLGDVPILGNLFRSSNYRRGETELVIIVTPYLVKPVDAGRIALPTDGFRSPSDFQRLVQMKENDGETGAERPKPRAAAPASNPAVESGAPVIAGRQEDAEPATPGFSLD
ncbi:type II and III secretion system protein family protein [Pseudoblastomonas halimionae]|uniref:Secretion system protein n=1 Tax=Alteriqipengyuania halimionae TaxID=1926630 RepID=A0A6I4U4A0_9SPHN|nr:type II and III secretion system protein family protein [Alteriqipengyuania halimionae]MXP10184.1 secretion system protein [Alteriqipengyuania halimionae]